MSTIAVIDVGTNSTNLLVTDGQRDLERIIAVTRLGEGLHTNGTLSQDAMARTVATIGSHADRARTLGAQTILVAGTAACRRARNAAEFVATVRERTGLDLTVISADDEAQLAFAGALRGLPRIAANTLVIDIGGGSTELTVGVDSPFRTASIPVGAVTATESDLTTDPPRPADLTNVIGAVQDEVEEIGRLHPEMLGAQRVVGVAGTIVTVAAVEIGLPEFDDVALHGFTLTRDAAEDVFRTLATETLTQRRKNPGLPPERADVIVGGCCILVGIMRRLGLDEIVVSTRSLMDGAALHGRLSP